MRRVWSLIDRLGWVLAIVLVLLLGIAVLEQGVTQGTFRVASLRACHRLNIERARNNRNQLHDYQLFSLTIQLIGASLKHPTQPTTPAERKQAGQYLTSIEDAVKAKEWVPLTSCYPAVDRPSLYVAPDPVPFSQTHFARGSKGELVLPVQLRQSLQVGPGE